MLIRWHVRRDVEEVRVNLLDSGGRALPADRAASAKALGRFKGNERGRWDWSQVSAGNSDGRWHKEE